MIIFLDDHFQMAHRAGRFPGHPRPTYQPLIKNSIKFLLLMKPPLMVITKILFEISTTTHFCTKKNIFKIYQTSWNKNIVNETKFGTKNSDLELNLATKNGYLNKICN